MVTFIFLHSCVSSQLTTCRTEVKNHISEGYHQSRVFEIKLVIAIPTSTSSLLPISIPEVYYFIITSYSGKRQTPFSLCLNKGLYIVFRAMYMPY